MTKRTRLLQKLLRNKNKTKKRKYNKPIYTDISQITEHIFIGNSRISKDLRQLEYYGITHVVNCADELENNVKNYDENISWLWLPMIDCAQDGDVANYIPEAVKFIDEVVTNNNKVLVHCAAGISRSSSITIAYLMYKHNIRYERAFNRVKNMRSCCKPNSKFVEQLKGFDFSLL